MALACVGLKRSKERSLERRHPWVFSGAVEHLEGKPEEGDVVCVRAISGRVLGVGHFQDGGSICVRMLSFEECEIDAAFWQGAIGDAWRVREELGLCDLDGETNAFRLVHGEGDGLPGLVVDIYADTAVVQPHSGGMERSVIAVSDAVRAVSGDRLKAVLLAGGPGQEAQLVWGESEGQVEIREGGLNFNVDVVKGQKTGFFIDQREHRAMVRDASAGRRVLNAFSYTGGFSLYALAGGAKHVTSVDISAPAVAAIDRNLALNAPAEGVHEGVAADVMATLRDIDEGYDLMVMDPPAFAKHRSSRHQAIQAYKRLNEAAMRKIAPGGLLFTFSCSQVVEAGLFRGALLAAAIDAGREVRILRQLHQPADHPVSMFHPEGEYLKGFVLRVS